MLQVQHNNLKFCMSYLGWETVGATPTGGSRPLAVAGLEMSRLNLGASWPKAGAQYIQPARPYWLGPTTVVRLVRSSDPRGQMAFNTKVVAPAELQWFSWSFQLSYNGNVDGGGWNRWSMERVLTKLVASSRSMGTTPAGSRRSGTRYYLAHSRRLQA